MSLVDSGETENEKRSPFPSSCIEIEEIKYDNIEFLEVVGRGAFGVVQKAYYNGNLVAIKTTEGEAEAKAYKDEVEQLAKVQHANIIRLFGTCCKKPKVFLIMEYAECGSVYDLLHPVDEKAPAIYYSVGHAISWLYQCGLAVEYLHGMKPRPMIHRDLKPPNMLLTKYGTEIKICDFGTATDMHTHMTSNKGSAAWMAPEVFEGSRYSEKCDVYSFGIIIWEVITRRKPFDDIGTSAFRIMWAVHSGTRPPLIRGIPMSLQNVMTFCWHKDPKYRPPFTEIVKYLELLRKHVKGGDQYLVTPDGYYIGEKDKNANSSSEDDSSSKEGSSYTSSSQLPSIPSIPPNDEKPVLNEECDNSRVAVDVPRMENDELPQVPNAGSASGNIVNEPPTWTKKDSNRNSNPPFVAPHFNQVNEDDNDSMKSPTLNEALSSSSNSSSFDSKYAAQSHDADSSPSSQDPYSPTFDNNPETYPVPSQAPVIDSNASLSQYSNHYNSSACYQKQSSLPQSLPSRDHYNQFRDHHPPQYNQTVSQQDAQDYAPINAHGYPTDPHYQTGVHGYEAHAYPTNTHGYPPNTRAYPPNSYPVSNQSTGNDNSTVNSQPAHYQSYNIQSQHTSSTRQNIQDRTSSPRATTSVSASDTNTQHVLPTHYAHEPYDYANEPYNISSQIEHVSLADTTSKQQQKNMSPTQAWTESTNTQLLTKFESNHDDLPPTLGELKPQFSRAVSHPPILQMTHPAHIKRHRSDMDKNYIWHLLEPDIMPVKPIPTVQESVDIYEKHLDAVENYVKLQEQMDYLLQRKVDLKRQLDEQEREQKRSSGFLEEFVRLTEEKQSLLAFHRTLKTQLEQNRQQKQQQQQQQPHQQRENSTRFQ